MNIINIFKHFIKEKLSNNRSKTEFRSLVKNEYKDIYDFYNEISEAYLNEEIFTIDDIKKAVSLKEFNDLDIYVLFKDSQKVISASLSLLKYKNENNHVIIERFTSHEKLLTKLEELEIWPILKNRNDLYYLEGSLLYLIIGNYNSKYKMVVDELFYSLSDIIIGSLNYRNQSYDIIVRKISKLKPLINSSFKLKELCHFISEEEKSNIGYYQLNPLKELSEFKSNFQAPCDFSDYFHPYFKETINSGKPILFNIHKKNITVVIFPVIRKAQETRFVKDLIVLWSKSRIKAYTISNIIEYIEYYLNKKLIKTKLRSLINIQNEVILNINKSGINNRQELHEEFKRFSQKCLSQILETTFSYSAVLRLFNPYQKSLSRFVKVCDVWGDWDGCHYDRDNENIGVNTYKNSVNAFSFVMAGSLNKMGSPYVYIRNFNKEIPKDYKDIGLTEILVFRETSLSEICFPLFIGNTPFGTLNIESPIINAFENDISYLMSIKKSIESYYDINIKNNDVTWLADRSPVYTNVHELKQIMSMDEELPTNERMFSIEGTSILKQLVVLEDRIIGDTPINIQLLNGEIDKFILEHMDELTYSNYGQTLFYWKIQDELTISKKVFSKIKLLITNLIENIINHGVLQKDKVNVFLDNRDYNSKYHIIKIRVRTFGVFDDSFFDYLTFSPIIKENKYHYGMFLIGMLTRKLGGNCFIEKSVNKNNKFTVIELVLPLNKYN